MIRTITLILFTFFVFAQSIAQDKLNLDPTNDSRFTVTDKVWPANVGEGDVCLWNDDKLSAFTITIDDNIESDIPFWKTMITKYGFNFTWFVITEADSQYNVSNWQLFNDLATLGSQINGHDDRNWYNDPGAGETNPTDAEYLARLQATQTKINNEVTTGNNGCLTYAYPFGEGNETEARKVFTAIRGVNGVLNLADKVNYLDVNSISNNHIYGDQASRDKYVLPLLDKTSQLYNVNYYRGWGSTHFHGVSAASDQTKVDEFLQYLKDKEDLWIDGFTNVSLYAQSFATHNLVIDDVASNEIKFTLTDEMKDDTFNHPLTVKVRVDNAWTDVSATQNGADVEVEIITNDGNQYALVKAVPDKGQIILTGTGGSGSDWDFTIIAPTEDGYVSDPTIVTTNNPYLWGFMKLGKSDVAGNGNATSAIIPFKLPARPNGETVDNASLKVYVSYGREWITANIDLYGLPFVAENTDDSGRTIYAEDHYAGSYGDDQNGRGAIGLEDDYFAKNVDGGSLDTPRWEETAESNQKLIDYINAQYDAGAVEGDWIFLRLSIDNVDSAGAHYFKVEGGDSDTPAELAIAFSGDIIPPVDTTVEVMGAIEDNGAYGNGTLTANALDGWVGRPQHFVGGLKEYDPNKPAAELDNYDGAAIIPFLLPVIPAGKTVKDVSFSVNLEKESATWGTLNCDLYGINARQEATVLAEDFYAGDYNSDANAVGIQAQFIPNGTAIGKVQTSADGNSALLAFIKAQYAEGKAGEYVFFRINTDAINITTYLRIDITSADNTDTALHPKLVITYGGQGSNTAPVLDPIGNQTVKEGETLEVVINATDAEGDALTYTNPPSNLPSFATFTDNGDGTATLSIAPQSGDLGVYENITIVVSDSDLTDEETITITVIEAGGSDWDFEVTAPAEDGYVSDPSIISANNPYLWNEMKLGRSAVDGSGNTTSAIIPFKLPSRPSNETVDKASLKVYVSYGREWINANVDLYGLPFASESTGNTIHPEDHYAGEFLVSQGSRGAVGLEDDYFTKNVAQGNLDTSRWEETAENNQKLIDYINAQYDADAVEGDWIFLRLSMDKDDMTAAHYFKIEGGDSTTPATLGINFSGTAGVGDVDRGTLAIYPNPVSDGLLKVSLDGFSDDASLQIYSITGRLVHKDTIKVSSGLNYETKLNLNPGLYIVKLKDGVRSKTQKLIVQ